MLNKVQLIGNITHDLQKSIIDSNGNEITKVDFQLAINFKKDKVQFVNCVAFRNQADNLLKYTTKGFKIYVEGFLSIQKYTNNEGEDKVSAKVIVNHLIFLDKKESKINYRTFYQSDHKTVSCIEESDKETGKQIKTTYYQSDGTTRDYIIEWDKNTGHKTKETNYQADGKTVSYIREYDKNTGKPIKYIEY